MATTQRNLPLNDKYQVLNISRPGIESGCVACCDNCGKMIVNSALICNQTGEKFRVGLDCVKTLTKQMVNFSQYDGMLYSFNSCLKFMTLVNKANKIEQDDVFVTVYYTDAKGENAIRNEFKKPFIDFGFQFPN
jgi:hypothetical protein